MQNQHIADMFNEVADLLEIQGANSFRVRAYRNGARSLENLAESISDLLATPGRGLDTLDGIGKDLAAKIQVIVQTLAFTSNLTLNTRGEKQSILIVSPGSEVAEVAIMLEKYVEKK